MVSVCSHYNANLRNHAGFRQFGSEEYEATTVPIYLLPTSILEHFFNDREKGFSFRVG